MAEFLLLVTALFIPLERDSRVPVTEIPLPIRSAHLCAHDNYLFLSDFYSGKVLKVSLKQNKVVQELKLDAFEVYQKKREKGEARTIRYAAGGDITFAHGKLFVCQIFQGSLLVIDAATFIPVKRIPLGGEGRLVASPDGKTVYFANNLKQEFYVIDTKSYQHQTVAYPEGGRGIGTLTISPDGKRLYLGIQRGGRMANGKLLNGGNSFLAVYDFEKENYVGTVYLAQKLANGSSDDAIPCSFALSPKGHLLYVGRFQSEADLMVIDTNKLQQFQKIPLLSIEKNANAMSGAGQSVARFQRWLLIGHREQRRILVMDLTSNKVIATITAPGFAQLTDIVVNEKSVYLLESRGVKIIPANELEKALSNVKPNGKKPSEITLKSPMLNGGQ